MLLNFGMGWEGRSGWRLFDCWVLLRENWKARGRVLMRAWLQSSGTPWTVDG